MIDRLNAGQIKVLSSIASTLSKVKTQFLSHEFFLFKYGILLKK